MLRGDAEQHDGQQLPDEPERKARKGDAVREGSGREEGGAEDAIPRSILVRVASNFLDIEARAEALGARSHAERTAWLSYMQMALRDLLLLREDGGSEEIVSEAEARRSGV